MDSAGTTQIQDRFQPEREFQQIPSDKVSDIWEHVRNDVRSFVGPRIFDTWIAQLVLAGERTDSVTLAAPSVFVRDRIRNDYLKSINLHWIRRDNDRRCVRIEAQSDLSHDMLLAVQAKSEPLAEPQFQENEKNGDTSVNLTRSFETLVEGKSNELAVGIAKRLAVGEAGPVSVVLFHGPNGVGKTHLLQSIRRKRMEKEGPGAHTILMGAEELMLAFVEGVKRKDTSALRQKMRSAAILLLDDIHMLKQGTLREFFSHLRAITGKGGWVVMTSDSSADRIQLLDARMRDEMHGGVGIRIDPPDTEMRAEIVRVKTELIARDFPGFALRDDWVDLLANSLPPSGRAIDGAVRTIFAATILVDKPVTEAAVRAALGNESRLKKTRIETIKDVVAAHYQVSRSDLESASRNRAISRPRQIAMYISRQATTCSYPQIGRIFGGRDHTTVIYACTKISELMNADSAFADLVAGLQRVCVDHPDNDAQNRFIKHS